MATTPGAVQCVGYNQNMKNTGIFLRGMPHIGENALDIHRSIPWLLGTTGINNLEWESEG